MTHFESETRCDSARTRSVIFDPDSSIVMADCDHVWFRPFRDELSLRRDNDTPPQKRKRTFRGKYQRNCHCPLTDSSITPGEEMLAHRLQPVTVAQSRRTHYDAAYLELAIREALPLASLHPGERGLAARVGALTA